MKITSHYRGNRTEVLDETCVMTKNTLNGVTLKQKRHYNGNEKFYEVHLNKAEVFASYVLIAEVKPKSKLVRLAEYIDTLINKLRSK